MSAFAAEPRSTRWTRGRVGTSSTHLGEAPLSGAPKSEPFHIDEEDTVATKTSRGPRSVSARTEARWRGGPEARIRNLVQVQTGVRSGGGDGPWQNHSQLRVRTSVRAGGGDPWGNHSQLRVRTCVRAGGGQPWGNHPPLRVRSGVKVGGGGGPWVNHSQLRVGTRVKAGGQGPQHNQIRIRTSVRSGGGQPWTNHSQLRMRSGVRATGGGGPWANHSQLRVVRI
jgi:hypothetical protein